MKLNKKWAEEMNDVKDEIIAVKKHLERCAPPSRERSLAITKLDEAWMWTRFIPIEEKE